MKKFLTVSIFIVVTLIVVISIFNIDVSTKQGINYKLYVIKIPLYLKTLDFFDRHYNYARLIKTIVKKTDSEEERLMKILKWTYSNIRKVPSGFPVIDDHVWHIIIRGYGTDDQFQDVFSTLCNYARLDAFFDYLCNQHKDRRKYFSFVRLKNNWLIFDVYNGVYFKNKKDKFANIGDISTGNWQLMSLAGNSPPPDYYAQYFNGFDFVESKNWQFSRSATQSPLRRFIYGFKGKTQSSLLTKERCGE